MILQVNNLKQPTSPHCFSPPIFGFSCDFCWQKNRSEIAKWHADPLPASNGVGGVMVAHSPGKLKKWNLSSHDNLITSSLFGKKRFLHHQNWVGTMFFFFDVWFQPPQAKSNSATCFIFSSKKNWLPFFIQGWHKTSSDGISQLLLTVQSF